MRKMKMLLLAGLLVLAMGMLTACGNDNNNADETPITEEDSAADDALTDENIPQTTVLPEQEVQDEYGGTVADDDAMNNGTVTGNGTMNNGTVTGDDSMINDNGGVIDDNSNAADENDGTVSGALGDGVEDLGEGVGEAVRDVGDAVGNAVDGR